ncbi:sensor histidine kinase [Streptomyces sp. NPDC126933]|uniref:sensor histidine kinase n=1 Tax=unclassified Streptomyces TaxID=2593676 RepID=UPI003669214D
MATLTGWWHRKSKPVKIEFYTRWSFHFFGVIEVVAIGIPSLPRETGPLGGWLFLLVCTHAGLCTALQARALDWRLGRRDQPVKLVLAVAVLSTAGLFAALALRGTDTIPDNTVYALSLGGFAGFGLGSIALGLRTAAQMTYAVLGMAGAVAAASLLLGLAGRNVFGNALGVAATGSSLVLTYVFSAWLLKAVWDLDAAGELQSRLAVAEERLRFGRDLHDVMGRNLAVIALKSELAVQLAERGRPESVAQMSEVQRIARESQREIRDVVRGYREADLHNELEGAQGVLKAASIECVIEGDDGRGLSAEIQSTLGWVVREATTNVLRHGDARRCTVRLTELKGREAILVVENDGVPEAADETGGGGRKGSGLAGLRERLSALNGTLDAGRAGAGRFRLTARVPLPVARRGGGAASGGEGLSGGAVADGLSGGEGSSGGAVADGSGPAGAAPGKEVAA